MSVSKMDGWRSESKQDPVNHLGFGETLVKLDNPLQRVEGGRGKEKKSSVSGKLPLALLQNRLQIGCLISLACPGSV